MDRRVGALALACAVSAAVAFPAAASARTKVAFAGGPVGYQSQLQKRYGAGANAYLQNSVVINQGDTVLWNGKALAAGFHTVEFLGKAKAPFPLIVPQGSKVSGALDPAGNPFWFNGLPNLGFSAALVAPSGGRVYNGTQTLDSGLPLGKPTDFKVKFTKAGTYKYYCNVHYGMVGVVVVRPKGKPVPGPRQDAQALLAQEAQYVNEAKATDKTKVTGNNVSLGASAPGGLEVFAMFPQVLRVSQGTTVTFSMSRYTRETHTASFGPLGKNSYLTQLANTGFNMNPFNPAAPYPSDPGSPLSLSPTTHGVGFVNTGALDRDSASPLPASGKITFTTPGTYNFVCLIHPFMHGTVIVS